MGRPSMDCPSQCLSLAKTRKRGGCDNKATIKRAHKIPLHSLDPVFISWLITVKC